MTQRLYSYWATHANVPTYTSLPEMCPYVEFSLAEMVFKCQNGSMNSFGPAFLHYITLIQEYKVLNKLPLSSLLLHVPPLLSSPLYPYILCTLIYSHYALHSLSLSPCLLLPSLHLILTALPHRCLLRTCQQMTEQKLMLSAQ